MWTRMNVSPSILSWSVTGRRFGVPHHCTTAEPQRSWDTALGCRCVGKHLQWRCGSTARACGEGGYGGMAQWNADWQNHISVDIPKKGKCFKVYSPLGVHYATKGTWLSRLRVVSFPPTRPMGSKLYAQCSSRILKINKSRCHARKVLEIRRGCIAKKRKWTYQNRPRRCFKRIHSLGWRLGMDWWNCPFEYKKKAFGGWEQDAEQAQHIFYSWPLVGGNDFFFEKFAWHQNVILLTNQIFVAIYFWVTFVNGICLIILANRVIYSLANTSKQSKDMPQAFFNIPRLLQTMVKVSLTCALHTCFYSPFPFAPLRVSWTKRSMSAMPFGRSAKGMSPSLGVSGLWRQWGHFPLCRCWVFLRVGC